MLRRSVVRSSGLALYDFVDGNFLNNKRPAIPGGAWPVENLRSKSLADLQQIWFQLVKERNMLTSTREHYLKHQEELGAMPAPSRLTMVEESMTHLKQVVRERDEAATAQAVAIFHERLARGVYRYPPGPPPPPGAHDPTVVVKVTLSKRVEPERLRALFGRYDVFEPHRGIVRIELRLPEEVLERKRAAEGRWAAYLGDRLDVRDYHAWSRVRSMYDYTHVELAPGVYANDPLGAEEAGGGGGEVIAASLPVPPPAQRPAAPTNTLERLQAEKRSQLAKRVLQLRYFPNVTLEPPAYGGAEAVPRPVHPDEIQGPWEALLTYDAMDGLAYAQELAIQRIDGAEVLGVEALPREPQPFAAVDPVFQEAVRGERATEQTLMQWPHVPEWKYAYSAYTTKDLANIIQHNYSNVLDYVDREVLLTGRSVWEMPIEVDYTCGGYKSIPAHAVKPKRFLSESLRELGITDL